VDLYIPRLGEPKYRSPLLLSTVQGDRICNFVLDEERILFDVSTGKGSRLPTSAGDRLEDRSFEQAGPREYIYFDPSALRVGIVTCGGLCPGTNNVIRAAVMELAYHYRVASIHGFRYGLAGLVPGGFEPIELTPDVVDDIHHHGGSILGSSRGPQDVGTITDTLERMNIGLVLIIGGDGTMRASQSVYDEVTRRGAPISVVGIPKTIDNDVYLVEKTFGFETAFSIAIESIRAAHTEAKGYLNGIGLVRLMGRQSGYIAASAAVAEPDVNFVLIPEIPFTLAGLMAALADRLERRHHAVIVVAEGAGQDLAKESGEAGHDLSGNVKLRDIGLFLKERISIDLNARGITHSLKYIDPSYMIRSAPANPNDSIFCSNLARHAVHAGMSGRTGMLVGLWNNEFTHVPLRAVTGGRNTVNPEGDLWLAVVESTGQPSQWCQVDRLAST
jgi:6-phosphofructokinase 1